MQGFIMKTEKGKNSRKGEGRNVKVSEGEEEYVKR